VVDASARFLNKMAAEKITKTLPPPATPPPPLNTDAPGFNLLRNNPVPISAAQIEATSSSTRFPGSQSSIPAVETDWATESSAARAASTPTATPEQNLANHLTPGQIPPVPRATPPSI